MDQLRFELRRGRLRKGSLEVGDGNVGGAATGRVIGRVSQMTYPTRYGFASSSRRVRKLSTWTYCDGAGRGPRPIGVVDQPAAGGGFRNPPKRAEK